MKIATIGLDLAKHSFQVRGVDAAGRVTVRRRLRRGDVLAYFRSLESCLVGMEACATAHHWVRELTALGHRVKLMRNQFGPSRGRPLIADSRPATPSPRPPRGSQRRVKAAARRRIATPPAA